MFGGFQYYQSQQLLSEVRRTEVIRYILSSDPTNKAMIEKIDTVFREKGVDAIYNQVKPKSVIRISLCRTAKRNPLIFPI